MENKGINAVIVGAIGQGFQKEICDFLEGEGFTLNQDRHPHDLNDATVRIPVYEFEYKTANQVKVKVKVVPFGEITIHISKGEIILKEECFCFKNYIFDAFTRSFQGKYQEAMEVVYNTIYFANDIEQRLRTEKD